MQLRPQKDCSYQESQGPAPAPGLSLPSQPGFTLCKSKAGRVTEAREEVREVSSRGQVGYPLASALPSTKWEKRRNVTWVIGMDVG